MAERKTDRRTIYTKNIIKDSLLALLHHSPYEKITVTALCKEADITRATFYLHYGNIDDVLNELLDEALRLTELDTGFSPSPMVSSDPDTTLPVCQRAASDPKYRILFLDETMSHHILEKLYQRERGKKIPELMKLYRVSEWEADKLFIYMLYGSFAVNKSLNWNKDTEWYHAQKIIQKFTAPSA